MAKYPSLLKNSEIGKAQRVTKCSFNKKHVMQKGDSFLLIKSPSIKPPFFRPKKYCINCAKHVLDDAKENLNKLSQPLYS